MTALFLVFTFIKEGLKTTKVKSTACHSKKIKTNHQRAFCATHQLLSYPFICGGDEGIAKDYQRGHNM